MVFKETFKPQLSAYTHDKGTCSFKELLSRVQWLMPAIPALWEAEVGRSLEARSSRLAWPTWWNPVSTKNTKITQAWWCAPVIPATRKAEAGEWPQPRRQGLWWADIAPSHSSLSKRVRFCLKKQKTNKTKQKTLRPWLILSFSSF